MVAAQFGRIQTYTVLVERKWYVVYSRVFYIALNGTQTGYNRTDPLLNRTYTVLNRTSSVLNPLLSLSAPPLQVRCSWTRAQPRGTWSCQRTVARWCTRNESTTSQKALTASTPPSSCSHASASPQDAITGRSMWVVRPPGLWAWCEHRPAGRERSSWAPMEGTGAFF